MATKNSTSYEDGSLYVRRNFWSGFLFGLGLILFVDEVIFHQLLRWHHFYDKSTTDIGIISDGILHALSWFATIAGLFLLADLRRKSGFLFKRWLAGVLIGVGGFQLYDGIIQHKMMRLHQIRYVDNVLLYDIVWNVIAAIILAIGIFVMIRTREVRQ